MTTPKRSHIPYRYVGGKIYPSNRSATDSEVQIVSIIWPSRPNYGAKAPNAIEFMWMVIPATCGSDSALGAPNQRRQMILSECRKFHATISLLLSASLFLRAISRVPKQKKVSDADRR